VHLQQRLGGRAVPRCMMYALIQYEVSGVSVGAGLYTTSSCSQYGGWNGQLDER
jgi:hypothetical protein